MIPWREVLQNPLASRALYHWSMLRALVYTAESAPLTLMHRLALALEDKKREVPQAYNETVIREAQKLIAADVERIREGVYPPSVLLPDSPLAHLKRLRRVWVDAAKVAWRRRQNNHYDFSATTKPLADELPDYYQRNFHFQTEGYLSSESAAIYDHQVEILFRGAAGAMRRLMLAPMRRHFKNKNGKGLHFLEVGAGGGSATIDVLRTFPEATVTVLDLSYPYLKQAQRRLKDFPRVNFVHGDAAQLHFPDNEFDAVYSVFLFHELPKVEREKVIKETLRVLKAGGIWLMVDSLQLDDNPDLNWGLTQFPKDFHEPFYANYVKTPIEDLLKKAKAPTRGEDMGLVAKCVWSVKNKSNDRVRD